VSPTLVSQVFGSCCFSAAIHDQSSNLRMPRMDARLSLLLTAHLLISFLPQEECTGALGTNEAASGSLDPTIAAKPLIRTEGKLQNAKSRQARVSVIDVTQAEALVGKKPAFTKQGDQYCYHVKKNSQLPVSGTFSSDDGGFDKANFQGGMRVPDDGTFCGEAADIKDYLPPPIPDPPPPPPPPPTPPPPPPPPPPASCTDLGLTCDFPLSGKEVDFTQSLPKDDDESKCCRPCKLLHFEFKESDKLDMFLSRPTAVGSYPLYMDAFSKCSELCAENSECSRFTVSDYHTCHIQTSAALMTFKPQISECGLHIANVPELPTCVTPVPCHLVPDHVCRNGSFFDDLAEHCRDHGVDAVPFLSPAAWKGCCTKKGCAPANATMLEKYPPPLLD